MARRSSLPPGLVLLVLVVLPAVSPGAGPVRGREDREDPELAAAIRSSVRDYNELTGFPLPELDSKQLAALSAGEVVKTSRRQPLSGEDESLKYRALAFLVVDQPLRQVWLGIHDPHFAGDSSYTHVRLEDDDEGGSISYGHAALPWPVRDRQWVVYGRRGTAIATTSGNRIWEYSWTLAADGPARAKEALENGLIPGLGAKTMKKAIYLPASTGAWTVIDLDEGDGGGDGDGTASGPTLLAYQVTLDLGGWISEKLVASFARRQLERLLRLVALNAARVSYHYDAEHEPVLGADLEPVPPLVPRDLEP